MKKVLTLCIPIKDETVLLGRRKRGFGSGLWNGFGRKIKAGETIAEATLRELFEEVGIKDGTLSKAGILEFSFENETDILQVHIFKLLNFPDEPVESEEMMPKWFSFDQIPFSQMWPDDKYWFPLLLKNKLFKGEFHFDRPSDAEYSAQIIFHKLAEVSDLR